MPFCHQCGAENPASARFCDQCGATMIPVPASAPSSTAGPPPATSTPLPANTTTPAGPGTCPQCGMAVIPGEAFCDHCGASLLSQSRPANAGPAAPTPPFQGAPPQPSYPPPQPVGSPLTPPAQPTSQSPNPPMVPQPAQSMPAPAAPTRTTLAGVQLIVSSTGAALSLPAAPQALVGRADPVSNYYPDVDLASYGALENGVGRRHMQMLVQNGQIVVEDLDSTNGTFVNTQKLAARTPHPLNSGDELRLGRLVLRMQA